MSDEYTFWRVNAATAVALAEKSSPGKISSIDVSDLAEAAGAGTSMFEDPESLMDLMSFEAAVNSLLTAPPHAIAVVPGSPTGGGGGGKVRFAVVNGVPVLEVSNGQYSAHIAVKSVVVEDKKRGTRGNILVIYVVPGPAPKAKRRRKKAEEEEEEEEGGLELGEVEGEEEEQ